MQNLIFPSFRVDFKPDSDSTATRKFLLNQHRGSDKRLKEFLFDGTMIFTPHKYVAAMGEVGSKINFYISDECD